MSTQAESSGAHVGLGQHRALVLADDDTDMWIVNARFESPPQVGTRFTFKGTEWQIAWQCEQGFGARPAH